MRVLDSMRRKIDPKAKKTIIVGYDRYTDKIYRVFDLERKIVERVANVTIEDITNTVDQVLFPLPPEEQEKDEVIDENPYIEGRTNTADSDNDFMDMTEDVIKTSKS